MLLSNGTEGLASHNKYKNAITIYKPKQPTTK